MKERGFWNQYQRAYDKVLNVCNAEHAPWYVVPANRKWYRNLIVSRILRETLEKMNPHFPPPEKGLDHLVID